MACRRIALFGALLLSLGSARADVHLNPLFSDHMVLQQRKPVPIWGTADPGEAVTVSLGDRTAGATADAAGRWQACLPSMPAGGPKSLTVQGRTTVTVSDVMIGEVWICSGQSNMQWTLGNSFEGEKHVADSADEGLRLLTVRRHATDEPLTEAILDQPWSICGPQTAGNFSAVGYHFGAYLRRTRHVPIGLISTNYGGTPAEAWTRQTTLYSTLGLEGVWQRWMDALTNFPAAMDKYNADMATWRQAAEAARAAGQQAPRQPGVPYGPTHVHRPGGLHNAMIAPLQPYAIAGAIWYQGESNAGRAYEYRTLMPTMIQDWRDGWGQGDFPFLLVQLAPFMAINPEPMDSAWAELREAQLLSTRALPNVGMAVITDVGEENDIHPRKKQPVGQRLGLAARAIAYGEDVEYSGPSYERMTVEGSTVRLEFSHTTGGLRFVGGPAAGFTVCGPDHVFHNASAGLGRRRSILVSCPEVAEPVAVRYGWANYPVVNLWNGAGLPASPFRTDTFKVTTQP